MRKAIGAEREKGFSGQFRLIESANGLAGHRKVLSILIAAFCGVSEYGMMREAHFVRPSFFSFSATRSLVLMTLSEFRDMLSMPSSTRNSANSGKSDGA
jgi:hypothetical protein